MSDAPAQSGWFLRCAAAAAVLLLACGLATAWIGNGPQLPLTTQDRNIVILERYVRGPTPDVLLLGSSLTNRLSESYFGRLRIRNIAMPGGSAATGIEIVAATARLPKLILVETNVMGRAVEQPLVDQYARGSDRGPLFFRPIKVAVAAYEDWLHRPPGHAQVAAALERMLREPPSSFDNRVHLARALQQAAVAEDEPTIRRNVARLAELIPRLEAGGARVMLFELPQDSTFEQGNQAATTRRIVRAAFPDPARWLDIDVPRSELRWPDGVHLDERSALLVARFIDGHVN